MQKLLVKMLTNANSNTKDSAEARDLVTITFRLNKTVLESFRADSEKTGISINVLVNTVLNHYVDWDKFESRLGMIPFPKVVLGKVFSELRTDQIAQIASNVGKETAIDMAIFMKGRIGVLDFVSWIESRMGNSGFEIIHRMDGAGKVHTVTIKHDLGKNWSLYLKTMLESALADFFKKPSEFVVSDSMVSLIFSM